MTPILQLAVEMAQVALRKDYSIRAVTTPDTWEAQMLINGFNAMINEIEAKDRLMESLVIERTRDLTSALLEAESAQSKAEKANKAKSEFLASMSHEIRTPINGISALTDLVLTTNLDSQQKEDLKSIRTCLIQLRSIIDSILDLSKIEAGKFHIESSVFNIRQAVENPIVLLRQQALGKGILFNYSIDQNIPLFCRGDATRLTQIINNLVGNAIKFTSTNQSITVNIGLINPITGPIFSLLIEVKDTGIGMTDEQLKHVLEPFHQVDTSTSQKYGGTGLGLTIVSKIVTLMRGEMTLKSEKNVGTTVTIKVPINVATFNENQHECEGNVDSVQIHDNTSRSLEGIVLLIEDNEINRTAVTRLLEQSGLSVVSAENGEKGLELFYLFGSFDVIVTDLRMPVMDGYTAARQIRQLEESSESNKNRIPIIALTADLTETVQERCLEAGIDHVVAKPVNVQELLRTIADRMN
jgi:signal transduction histidine kinase/CheY-like chemotaxis protein